MNADPGLECRDGVLEPGPAGQLAGVLGVDPPRDELPPMWHWAYLLDRRPRSALAGDGHPGDGLPRPPAEPHRRLFAGGRTEHRRPLRLGGPVRKVTRQSSTTHKQGRSGRLTFATVRSDYVQDGEIAVTEEIDIVYRPAVAGSSTAGAGGATEVPSVRAQRFAVDEVVLFLFSCVTANAHRIHYDLEFARSEGHPGLVIHGPLQVLLMAGALPVDGASIPGRTLEYRLLAPAWGAQTLTVGAPVDGDGDVVVLDAAGRRVARASLTP